MEVFDGPAPLPAVPRRESSTHAPQALELLNGSTSNELAEAFAARVGCRAANARDFDRNRQPRVPARTAAANQRRKN